MDGLDVLTRVDCPEHLGLVDVRRERPQHEDPGHGRVRVHLPDPGDDLVLSGGGGESAGSVRHAVRSGQAFQPTFIGQGAVLLTDQHGGEPDPGAVRRQPRHV